MKKLMYVLLFAIIALFSYSLFNNAKTHVETVEAVEKLAVETDSLHTTVSVLSKSKDSALTQIEALDSTLTAKDQLIMDQKTTLTGLKRDAESLKKMGPIIIRDTVYITETRNFWGKTKKTVEKVSDADTLELEESAPALELEPDTLQ